jgi:two-component system, OmpR family, response regulator
MAKILLVEDEPDVAQLVSQGLIEVGHKVDQTERGDVGLQLASEGHYDLLIVDRILPGMDGLTLVQHLRENQAALPVLFLSGLGELHERVEGLNSGADDYLPKPFAFSELVARINALLRRPPYAGEPLVLCVGDLEMDVLKRRVTRAGRAIGLLPREYALLEFLMRRVDQVVTRTMLLEGVWNYRFDPKTNIVETHISRLRAKIGGDLIQTVRSSGYLMRSARK